MGCDPAVPTAFILDSIEDIILHLDASREITGANRAAMEALRTGSNPVGTLWADLWRNFPLSDEQSAIVRSISEGREISGDLPFPDGRHRRISLARIPGEADAGFLVTGHDTTEKRLSAQLLESTRAIVEAGLSSPDALTLYESIHAIISGIVQADDFYIALYDSKQDLITFPYFVDRYDVHQAPRRPGRGVTEIVLRSGRPAFITREGMANLIRIGEVQLIGELAEWWMGVPLSVEGRVVGVMVVQSYAEDTALTGMQEEMLLSLSGTAAMVIEKKRSEEALKESENRYRNLVERASDGIVIASDGKVWFANPVLAEMVGRSREDMEGQPFSQFLPPSQRDIVYGRHIQRLSGETDVPPVYETALLHADGHEVPVELSASVLMEGGKPSILAVLRDISGRRRIEEERRLLERQIQHSQKLESLGILAGGIAHDFNNLLMGILGNAGLALMELPPESPVRRTLERLETAALRAAELTNQLLAYSGRGKFIVEPININILIEEMVNLLQAAVPKNVVLRLDVTRSVPLIEGDATQLRQVVMNLIMNAAEAIGDRSGIITISSGATMVDRAYLSGAYLDEDLPEGPYTFIEVSDTGCGMDDKTKSRIFDPFFTTKFTGRGLGLAAVLGIVRGHHGTLKVYSEPGRGSTFKILIPSIGDSSTSAHHSVEGESGRSGSGVVMVVDDEETVRTVARLALEKAGFRVLTASDGKDAIEVFRREGGRIDLILLDLTMPHLNGEETFRELRRMKPDVRVVLSSGYNEMDTINKFAGKGLAGFIQKPYRPVDLIARIRSVLSADSGNGRKGGAPGDLQA